MLSWEFRRCAPATSAMAAESHGSSIPSALRASLIMKIVPHTTRTSSSALALAAASASRTASATSAPRCRGLEPRRARGGGELGGRHRARVRASAKCTRDAASRSSRARRRPCRARPGRARACAGVRGAARSAGARARRGVRDVEHDGRARAEHLGGRGARAAAAACGGGPSTGSIRRIASRAIRLFSASVERGGRARRRPARRSPRGTARRPARARSSACARAGRRPARRLHDAGLLRGIARPCPRARACARARSSDDRERGAATMLVASAGRRPPRHERRRRTRRSGGARARS